MNALPYLLHGTTLALAWFVLLNLAATAAVAIAARRLTEQSRAASPAVWLALRLTPAALSVLFVAAVFLPSYWRYEPRESVEGFDVTLTAFAVLGVAVIGTAAARGLLAWRRAGRRADAWLQTGRPLTLQGTSLPAFVLDTEAPAMALVGVLRPRLLITRPMLDVLTSEELQAGVAHELGHWRACDNLKRLAMRAAPDLLAVTGAARAIERRWAAASEHAADRSAANNDQARCALASALVKAARLTPPLMLASEPICALVEGGDVTSRVQQLLNPAPSDAGRGSRRWPALAIPAAALAISYTPLLRLIHDVTEILVNRLP